jgi:ligand-binding SRPBCC domain-containing protein
MKIHTIQRTQRIPVKLHTAWDFFSSPANLAKITPDYMGFEILSNSNSQVMYAGQIITYHIRPVANIPLYWMTEITHVKHHEYFVDEQRFGPYALWHHTHRFTEIENGTVMEDLVHYKMPWGILGTIAHQLLVKKQLSGIFNYRYSAIEKLFGKYQG